ncbi:Adenine specific DNA methyltransferase [Leifsonia rubra CMS 76R]|nr:Adenine specific DNA methyltransferase [Leifsonia rubra CMS 76R]
MTTHELGRSMLDETVAALVSQFGSETKERLAGVGEPEEALRVPIDHLISAIGHAIGKKTILDGETHLSEISSRPDFAVRVHGAVVGYIEVKQAGLSLDPTTFKGHNKDQWNRLKGLPNLVYTNGSEWRLYRAEDTAIVVAQLSGGPLDHAGSVLHPDTSFRELVTNFLSWAPAPIRTVPKLVRTVAPITRMLRTKVREQLLIEHANVERGEPANKQIFLGLASDWRKLLFPDASDEVFSDGYAQTVTFALLLARTEKVDLEATSLHLIGKKLGTEHSLMGKALQLLTEGVSGDFVPTIDLLRRVIGAVEWDAVRKNKDTYLHLYENFLAEYDPELRRSTGTYFTPHEVVDQMVRLTEEVLVTKLGKSKGFLDPSVTTIDPAMGTGTFLHSIIEHVAVGVAKSEGPGAVPGTITELASRLIGFELQLGSYAVAELRTTDLLRSHDASPPKDGMRMFVADTLSDPDEAETELGSGLGAISESKQRANTIKSSTPVTVVIGNPPYGDKAEGQGGWIEKGSEATSGDKTAKQKKVSPLDDFRLDGNGLTEYVLKNLYVYFWRWATWKVFESVPSNQAGVICFISTAGYLRGPGFKGMREYLRREADEGWIIDLTPEGQTPDIPTRVFPGVRQPLAIAIFIRRVDHQSTPAPIWCAALTGKQADKFAQLKSMTLNMGWSAARTGWTDPLTAASAGWDDWADVGSIFPWVSPGVAPHRTWVYAPTKSILRERWTALLLESDAEKRATLFKSTRDSSLLKFKVPLTNIVPPFSQALTKEMSKDPSISRVAYRSFDRQLLIADHRVLDTARPDLWSSLSKNQMFLFEQHSHPISGGPALIATRLIPDMHYFNNRGGRVLPILHPDGTPNLAPGFLDVLAAGLGLNITHEDVLAYIAGVTSHPGFTAKFEAELSTPGVRVPITKDPALWMRAVELGREVVWLHTYGEAFIDKAQGRSESNIRDGWPAAAQPLSLTAVKEMPIKHHFDDVEHSIYFTAESGERNGSWGPVGKEVFDYTVGGMNVIGSWFKYRKKNPGGKKTSPLDDVHVDEWPHEWTLEFTELLTVLTRLVSLEQAQATLLGEILVSELSTQQKLADAGVHWPKNRKDRTPRRKPTASDSPQLDIPIE